MHAGAPACWFVCVDKVEILVKGNAEFGFAGAEARGGLLAQQVKLSLADTASAASGHPWCMFPVPGARY